MCRIPSQARNSNRPWRISLRWRVSAARSGYAFRAMLQNQDTTAGAGIDLATSLGIYLGQGGWFDYQRQGNRITSLTPLPHYRDVSNFNVGLFRQQAGCHLTKHCELPEVMPVSFPIDTKRDQSYGLEQRTRSMIATGFNMSASGTFDEATAQ